MAVALVDELLVLNSGSNSGSYTATSDFTVAGGANNILLVAIMMCNNSTVLDNEVDVTAEGVAMTPWNRLTYGAAGSPYGGLYYIINPSAGATTIVGNPTTDIGRGMIIWCGEYSGVNASDPFGSTVSSETTDTTPPGITPEAAGHIVVSMMAGRGGANPYTEDSNVTPHVATQSGTSNTGDVAGFVGQYTTVGTSQVDVFATAGTPGSTVAFAVELIPSDITHTSSGAITTPAATASGTVERTVTSSGAATMTPATASGTVERVVTSSGALTTGEAFADGAASFGDTQTAEGDIITPAATVSGTATRVITSSGALTIGSVEVSGTIYTPVFSKNRGKLGLGMGLRMK